MLFYIKILLLYKHFFFRSTRSTKKISYLYLWVSKTSHNNFRKKKLYFVLILKLNKRYGWLGKIEKCVFLFGKWKYFRIHCIYFMCLCIDIFILLHVYLFSFLFGGHFPIIISFLEYTYSQLPSHTNTWHIMWLCVFKTEQIIFINYYVSCFWVIFVQYAIRIFLRFFDLGTVWAESSF